MIVFLFSFLCLHAQLACSHDHVRLLWSSCARTCRSEVSLVETIHHDDSTRKNRKLLSFLVETFIKKKLWNNFLDSIRVSDCPCNCQSSPAVVPVFEEICGRLYYLHVRDCRTVFGFLSKILFFGQKDKIEQLVIKTC